MELQDAEVPSRQNQYAVSMFDSEAYLERLYRIVCDLWILGGKMAFKHGGDNRQQLFLL